MITKFDPARHYTWMEALEHYDFNFVLMAALSGIWLLKKPLTMIRRVK